MTDLVRLKKVYRVRSVHPIPYGPKAGETYTRTRHFFSKYNARASYNRLLWEKEGKEAPSSWGKPISVQFSESEPLVFMDDETDLLDTCQAMPHTGPVSSSLSGGTP